MHFQNTYLMSGVVSEYRWKMIVPGLEGEAASWETRIKEAFVRQLVMCCVVGRPASLKQAPGVIPALEVVSFGLRSEIK